MLRVNDAAGNAHLPSPTRARRRTCTGGIPVRDLLGRDAHDRDLADVALRGPTQHAGFRADSGTRARAHVHGEYPGRRRAQASSINVLWAFLGYTPVRLPSHCSTGRRNARRGVETHEQGARKGARSRPDRGVRATQAQPRASRCARGAGRGGREVAGWPLAATLKTAGSPGTSPSSSAPRIVSLRTRGGGRGQGRRPARRPGR